MRALAAFGLGLIAFPIFLFLGETYALSTAFSGLAVYFFACQFFLSRRCADAHRDWRIMLALDGVMLFGAILCILVESPSVVMAQVPGLVVSTGGGTYAGAMVAAVVARRSAAR